MKKLHRLSAIVITIATMLMTTDLMTIPAALAANLPGDQIAALDLSASLVSSSQLDGDSSAIGAMTNTIAGFPTKGASYLALSTGSISSIPAPSDEYFASTNLSAAASGADGNDLTRAHLHLQPPTSANCMAFDFVFLSEEYPDFVGTGYNDIFTAELGQSQFSKIGTQVVAPNNFAYDTKGNPVSVNTVFGFHGTSGTAFNGATPLLTATTPVKRNIDGSLDLYLSVQDLGDSIYDSAALIDNLRFFTSSSCTPGATALTDADSDGLPDTWETKGIDYDNNGTIDLDLPAMGADPQHKDVFIEADWMRRPGTCIWFICWGGRTFAPQSAAIADVRAAFANSPVTNPDGTTGIRAHIDFGPSSVMNPVTGATWGSRSAAGQVSYKASLGTFDSGGYNWSDYDAIKAANFSVKRRDVFHYMLFADTYAGGGSSGISRSIPASDTLVTDGHSSWGDGFTRIQERGTVMHEFGHNLGLRHGGNDDVNYKSNYLSIMNYSFQLVGLPPDNRLDYSRTSTVFDDWAHLVFNGGSVGAFGDVSLPTSTEDEKFTAEDAKSHNAFSVPFDGSVSFVGPTVLLPGTGTQKLAVDVTNISQTKTTYQVSAKASGLGLSSATSSITLAGGAKGRANLLVDTSKLTPGTYPVTISLSNVQLGAGISTAQSEITVPDLTDPAQAAAATDALAQLRSLPSVSGLDPAVLADLKAALVTALPWQAHLSLRGAPWDNFTADYQVHSPIFAPTSANPQTITIPAWATTRPLQLSLKRLTVLPGAYKGTMRVQRPDGRTVDATVTLYASADGKYYKGSWLSGTGGVVELNLTAP